MKIKMKSQLNTLFSVIMILTISAILLLGYSRMKAAVEKDRVVDQLNRGIFELNIATSDYLLTERKRALNQWQQRYTSLATLIRSEKFQSQKEKELLNGLQQNLERLHSIFLRLFKNGSSGLKVSGDLKERLQGHLLISSHSMLSIGRELSEICDTELLSFQRNTGFLIMLAIFIVGVIIAANSILLGRRIVRPIGKLREGARAVGDGNLDFPLATDETDEIGDLSRAFDQMAKKLKTVMASRDDLEKEISERKRVEKELRNSNATLELAQKMAGLGYWSYDIETEMPTWSREMYTVFGVDPEQGQPSYEDHKKTWHPDDWDMFDQAVQDAIQLGKSYNIVIRIIFPDHSIHYVNTQGYPRYDEDEKITELYGISQDITERTQREEERKQLQDQLQQSQKMESIGTLAGGIAHDFNNILGIILGNAELAMDDVPEWNPARKNLDEVRKACMRAKDVVRQILSFSRKSEIEQKSINIASVVVESLKLSRASIPTSIEMRQNIANDVDDILGDPTQIHQVMINLCTNAAHAMENDGGILEVTLESTEIDEGTASQYPELNPGPHVHLGVSDTGDGIKPEIVDRVFDPYFTTKEVGKGTGMGLAVVHGIVKSHHGTISVESEPGKGTRFKILFPSVKEKVRDEPKKAQELPTGKESILFVDDEGAMVNLNQQRLERLGYKVIPKTDPLEALEFFRTNPDQIDLIISDMTMPHMTGDKLAQEILNIRPDMPIIICTGYSERMSEDRAQEIGIRKYIEKPIEMANLARSVREVLDGK